ncbi:MAG: pilus assembly protein [Gemmataceae bacterium]|nr:pilus assembly protein [Gemmataceae bacterium]
MLMLRSERQKRNGAALVEFALLANVYLLVLFGIIEYARFAFTRQIAFNAAREGVRLAIVRTTSDTNLNAWSSATAATHFIQDRVDEWLFQQGVNQWSGYDKRTSIQIYRADPVTLANIGPWTNAGFGDAICVQITGTWNSALLSFVFMGQNPVIDVRCVGYCEANL